ncbi:DEAD/DEAH box helicase [Caulobacter sp. S45]|uniref:DEAD/DEAH box helicase n=1 Tax=Caulobacter sp. S45 TaxID=1641861 RepID=UPI00131C8D19|nr:DEAD/DEAH box helicase [Caulobacter sp. S45]
MSIPTLPPALAQALAARGYADLTPVQLAVTQPEAAGRDLLVSARTGSGKTVAYGLALAGDLLGENERMPRAGEPLALIVAPTRELALQVQRELEWLYAAAGATVVSCVGGMDPRREQRALSAGAHIVVGTPGRLRDHIERGQLRLTSLRAAVLDEADEMLDLGFREELEAILDAAPTERRTLLFSATLPSSIVAMARRYQRDALRLTVATGEQGHSDIDYRAVRIAPSDAENAVVNLLRYFDPNAALVFCATREAVRRLHANLVERGFSVVALSGELSQTERTHALQALRDHRARVCVATDVAARGIDIPDLELVIHADLPTGAETLQHRSGRTGRAGRKGVSAILVPHPRRRRAEALFRTANVQATWMTPPSSDEIRAKDQERLLEQLRPTGEAAEEDIAIAQALLADASAEQVVAALVRARRASLPSAEDLVDNEPERVERPAARPGFENTSWFKIDIGRNKNAEARWLLPMICRLGHITKSDIGAIRVFDRETRFEILSTAAERFFAAVQAAGADAGVNVEPLAEPDLPAARDRNRAPAGKRAYGDQAKGASAQSRGGDDTRPAHSARPQSKPYAKPYAKAHEPQPFRNGGDAHPAPSPRPHAKPYAKPQARSEPLPFHDTDEVRTAPAPRPQGKPYAKPYAKPHGGAGPQTSKRQDAKLQGGKPRKAKPNGKPNGKPWNG